MVVMAKLSQKSSIFPHSSSGSVISRFTHRPPLTHPAHSLFLSGSLGSIMMARVLPPIFFGPLSFQSIVIFSVCLDISAALIASNSASCGILLILGSIVIRKSC